MYTKKTRKVVPLVIEQSEMESIDKAIDTLSELADYFCAEECDILKGGYEEVTLQQVKQAYKTCLALSSIFENENIILGDTNDN